MAARGLDIPDVDWIVQYDPPDDPKVKIVTIRLKVSFFLLLKERARKRKIRYIIKLLLKR